MRHSISVHFQYAVLLCLLYMPVVAILYMYTTTEPEPNSHLDGVRLVIIILLAPIFLKYAIQLGTAPLYSLIGRIRQSRGGIPSDATVSVLIPAWNEEVGIIRTLKSVLNTRYKHLEVVVINDGSTDSTHELITEFVREHEAHNEFDATIKYLHLPNGGKALALNQGLSVAEGEFIITIDADSVMEKTAIDKFLKQFNDSEVAAVAGNVVIGNHKAPIEIMQQLEYLYGFFFKRADSVFNSVYIIGGAAAAYRKKVLLELGAFDHKIITEDIEMSTRILAHGYKTRYAADAVVYTEGPATWRGLFNQRLRWKYGRLLTFIKHRKLFLSCNKKHNAYLTFLLLPLAVYSELALLFEAVLLFIYYSFAIYTNDYLPLLIIILFVSSVVTLQIVFDPKSRFHRNLLILAPVAWLVFYIIDAVEFQALCRSLKRLMKREALAWQKWVRLGLPAAPSDIRPGMS